MARERYLVNVSEEDLRPSEKIGAPTTLSGKLANYWYHYKWPTLIAAFLIAVAVLVTVQLITRVHYDYKVVLVTETVLHPDASELLEQELAPFGEDINGDGAVRVLVDNIGLTVAGATMGQYAGAQKLATTVGSGDFVIYCVEASVYDAKLKDLLQQDATFYRTLPLPDGDAALFHWTGADARVDYALSVYFTDDYVWFVRAATGTAAGKEEESDAAVRLLAAYASGDRSANAAP